MTQPRAGTIEDGHYFKGGDASDQNNWVVAPHLGDKDGDHVYVGGDPSNKDSWEHTDNIPSGAIEAAVAKFAKASTFGYLPEIYAGAQQGIENAKGFISGSDPKDVYQSEKNKYDAYQNYLQNQNPIASTVGTVGGYVAPGMAAGKLVAGAKGLVGIGEAAKDAGLLSKIGGLAATGAAEGAIVGGAQNPEDGQSRGNNAAVGGLLGAGGKLLASGAGKILDLGDKYVIDPITKRISGMAAPLKEGAGDLLNASERLGVEPTKGMLTGDPYIQKTESALSQRPTTSGVELANKNKDLFEGLKDAGKFAFGDNINPEMTPYQAGGSAKELVQSGIENKLEKPIGVYNKIASEVSKIDIPEISKSRISNNILNLKSAIVSGSDAQTLAKQAADTLSKVKTLEDVRSLKTFVRQEMQDMNNSSTKRYAATDIYSRLTKLEQNTITRAAIAASDSPGNGKAVAATMIKEIKDANKVYANVSGSLKSLAKNIGLGRIDNYSDFIRKMGEVPDERFMDKIFNPKNVNALNQFKTEFPEAFDVLKKTKLSEMYVKSQNRGELSIANLVKVAKGLSPEYKKMLFGEDAQNALKDIETVYNSTYQKVGPSGTPEGKEYIEFNPINPGDWYAEIADRTKKYMLESTPGALKKTKVIADTVKGGILKSRQGGEMLRQSIPGSSVQFMQDRNKK